VFCTPSKGNVWAKNPDPAAYLDHMIIVGRG
jgi:hypothetical protein